MYRGRPGVSPTLAALLALDEVRPTDRVLEVGCGDARELALLAEWGFRSLTGVERDREELRRARLRVTKRGLASRVRLLEGEAADLDGVLGRETFDVALDNLLLNNLAEGEEDAYVRGVARHLRKGGLFVVHCRIDAQSENRPPGAMRPPEGLARRFRVGPSIQTHLPELRQASNRRDYALVATWIGRRR
ncbi:MAG: Methyltransferase domain [Thermoplasmata archaeon]|jgi:SAM-dependent methyltransferase|nr:Methyltransferase domain [Thermoplasmata archaeon]